MKYNFFQPKAKRSDYQQYEKAALRAYQQGVKQNFLQQLEQAAEAGSMHAAHLLANGYDGNHSDGICLPLADKDLPLSSVSFIPCNTEHAYYYFRLTYMHAYAEDHELATSACEGIAYLGFISEAVTRLKILVLEFHSKKAMQALAEIYTPSIQLSGYLLYKDFNSMAIQESRQQIRQVLLELCQCESEAITKLAKSIMQKTPFQSTADTTLNQVATYSPL